MKRIKIRIVLSVIIIIFINFIFLNVLVEASLVKEYNGATSDFGGADEKVKTMIGTVLDIVQTIGAGIAALIMLVLGCKYMLSSAEGRADIKKHAVPYVIGAIVFFGSSAISGIVKKFAINATGG